MSRPIRLGLYAAFLWGTHSVLVQVLTRDLGAIQIAAMRLGIAAVTLFVVLKALGQPISIPVRSRYFWLATGATFVNYILFHMGLERTNAASAMVLENTAPFFVLLILVIFLRTPVSVSEVGATLLAIVGVSLTVLEDLFAGGLRLSGDIMEIGAGLSWAVFLIASSRAMQASQSTGERLNFLFGIFLVAAILFLPIAAPEAQFPKLRDLLPLGFLGIFATALLYYCWYEAAADLSTLTASLMFALSVVFTFINAALFLGETIVPLQLLGAAMIIAGIYLTARAKQD
ncbi:MAG: DMT family transporter [Pseudomonadota bacterium]